MSNLIRSMRFAVLLSLMWAGLTACTGASPQVAYYTLLDDADIAKRPAKQHDSLVLSVGPVSIPGILSGLQIATGGTGGRYQLGNYHRWAGEIDREFARALAEQLAGRIGTEQVYVFPVNSSIQTTRQVLIDILEMNGELGKEAKLSVRWTLVDPKGKFAPFTRQNTFSQQPQDGGYDAWVQSQRRNINLLSVEIAARIKEQANSSR